MDRAFTEHLGRRWLCLSSWNGEDRKILKLRFGLEGAEPLYLAEIRIRTINVRRETGADSSKPRRYEWA